MRHMPNLLARATGRPAARRALLLTALALFLTLGQAQGQFWFASKPMPEFSNRSPAAWINSEPLSREGLAGQVVLIEIWTSI